MVVSEYHGRLIGKSRLKKKNKTLKRIGSDFFHYITNVMFLGPWSALQAKTMSFFLW